MDKSWMKLSDRFSIEYKEGIFQFLEVAKYHFNNYEQIRCPCKKSMNLNWDSLEGVKRHLLIYLENKLKRLKLRFFYSFYFTISCKKPIKYTPNVEQVEIN